MRITIETNSWKEWKAIMAFLQKLDLQNVAVSSPDAKDKGVSKGDKSLDPTALFGIWKEAPRTLEDIREKGWERHK